jgi:dynein heavy chain
LGGEKDSWKKKASEYEGETKHIIGDCMISSGIIAYLGAFPLTYRDTTIQAWKDLLNQL